MRLLFLLFPVLLALALPAQAQETNTTTIPVGDAAESDSAIANRMREIIRELGAYEDVSVTVNNGIVTLRGTTTSLLEANALTPLADRIEGVVAVKNQVTETTDVARRLDPTIDRFRTRAEAMLVFLPLALIALVIFGLIVWFGLWLARRREPWQRLAPNAFVADIIRQIVRLVFIVVGLVVALDILNATALLSTILGAAGIIGLALGFAVKDTVENFIASVMLSFRQPFRPNDAVEINGDEGKVIRLTSRATILLSYDGNHISIPNATVFKSRIVNFTRNAERQIKFEIGVAPDCDLAAVRELATATVAGLPYILNTPAPDTWIDRIGNGAIFLIVTGWIDQTETSIVRAKGEALRLVKNAIEAAGVEVPDTTYRIEMVDPATGHVPRPKPSVKTSARESVTDVGTKTEAELDRIIDDERAHERHDLLDDKGMRE